MVVFFFIATAGSQTWADAHDDAVYQRYSRKVVPGKIPFGWDMKFTELTRPATQKDVEKGSAVFTFEGLGPSRVWKLPNCPIGCEWESLRDYPVATWVDHGVLKTNFNNIGSVCQAEELQINGEWKRYFGFVSEHGVAVVPAAEIYFYFCDCDPLPRIAWNRLPGGSDWGMLGPNEEMQNGKIVSRSLTPADRLPVELFVRDRRGMPQKVLWDVYRNGTNGGPAFHQGIKLFLDWAPFEPRTPDRYYPRMEDFTPVGPIRTDTFDDPITGPTLVPGEMAKGPVVDLRDWFALEKSGYYHIHFEFNPAEMGLPTGEGNGGYVYVGFKIGSEPKRLTAEELNRSIPPLGGPENEAKLRALIKQEIDDGNKHSAAGGLTNSGQRRPVPKQLPKLEYTPFVGDNMSGMESEVVQLSIPNSDWLHNLELYDGAEVRAKLEALMQNEKVLPMKLLLASEAMAKGSQAAALFVLDCLKTTDYQAVRNAQDALRLALYHHGQNPPAWMVQMAIAALSDERYATGMDKAGWSSDTKQTLSYLADEDGDLTFALGDLKCTNAVPFLIEMAKKTDGRRGPVMALGKIGDSRAIPLLIDLVKQKGPSLQTDPRRPSDDAFLCPVEALGNLRAKEAVPVLLEYIEHPDVIEALENIGDPRAIQPLQNLILAKGKIEKAGVNNDPDLEQHRLAAARIAVASLDPDDHTGRLCELLADASFDQFQRRSVVWRLGDHPDPRAIPFLAKAIKTDESGAVVNQAISVLGVFKYKAAVDVLVDCFSADFQGKEDWKRAYKPEMFRDNIADSLRTLTGQRIGTDKAQWLKWWEEHRATVPGLK